MNRRTFLETVLCPEGLYCLKTIDSAGKGKQLFFDTIDQLITAANLFDANPVNTFYAIASFKERKEQGARKHNNIACLRTFFLDIDCGPDKGFKLKHEAFSALKELCKVLKLPKPFVVDSGGGFHAYWPLESAVTFEVWKPVAIRLKSLCKQHNFHSDHGLTGDGSRILRMPLTKNIKYSPPKDVPICLEGVVTSFEGFKAIVGEDEPLTTITTLTNPALSGLNQQLAGNKEAIFKVILTESLAGRGCQQIKYLVTHQNEAPEPLWRAGLSIAQFCSDRNKAIHFISKKHTEYDYDKTEAKASEIPKPQTCDYFSDANPEGCNGCPLKGKFKSPIAIGMRVQEAEVEGSVYKSDTSQGDKSEEVLELVTAPSLNLPNAPIGQFPIPKYPFPYFRGKNCGVYLRVPSDDGPDEEKLIYQHDVYVVKRTYDVGSGEALVLRVHLPKDGVREFSVDMIAASSKEELRKELAREGIMARDYNDLRNYIMQWVNELQVTNKADEAHRQFGWVGKNFDSFVIGNRKLTPKGVEFNPPSSHTRSLFPMFEPVGTLAGWQETIAIWNDPKFVLQQYALGISFGSILMELANVSCSAVHFYSKESGVGKSAILEAIASVWADPSEFVLSKEDTIAFKMNRCEVYHNLPIPLDEITNLSGEAASDMVYQFTGGKQRGRMSGSSNTERERGVAWSLMAATTGNTSILEVIGKYKDSPKAEAQRILECKVPRIFDEHRDKATTDAFSKGVQKNYGHAGPEFVQFVMHNIDEVREIATKIGKTVDRLANLTSENRFWSAQVTYTISGLFIAKKAGLVTFDIQPVLTWAVNKLLQSNKVGLTNMDGSAIDHMNDFIAEHISNILRIDSTVDRRKDSDLIDSYILPEEVARGRLVARYEPDTKMFYILLKPLMEWCGKRSIPYKDLRDDLIKDFGAEATSMKITRGFPLDLPKARVLKFRFDWDKDGEEGEEDEGEGLVSGEGMEST